MALGPKGWQIVLTFRKGWLALHILIRFDKNESAVKFFRRRGLQRNSLLRSIVVTREDQLPDLAGEVAQAITNIIAA